MIYYSSTCESVHYVHQSRTGINIPVAWYVTQNHSLPRACSLLQVRRWTGPKRLEAWGQPSPTVLQLDRIVVPFHLGNHWTCACIDLQAQEVVYCDSLGVSGLFVLLLRMRVGLVINVHCGTTRVAYPRRPFKHAGRAHRLLFAFTSMQTASNRRRERPWVSMRLLGPEL